MSYYRIDNILKKDADYNFIYGERGNGKTYAVQEYLINEKLKNGNECMIIRRWREDVTADNAKSFWDGVLVSKLKEMSGGKYTAIFYKGKTYYLGYYDDKTKPVFGDGDILGYVWSISECERLKGHSYPKVTNVLFDEFISISERGYMPGEVNLFLNEVSTITRDRDNVKFWLLGNTVNPYNPYFKHFNIDPLIIKQGDIYLHEGPRYGGKIAIEYCASRLKEYKRGSSAKYFEFGDDFSRQMIMGGKWQLPFYPTCKRPTNKPEWSAYIIYNDHWLRFEIINEISKNKLWAYVSSVKGPGTIHAPVFSLEPSRRLLSYVSVEEIDGEPILKNTIRRILVNKKIWYDNRMTACWLQNYLFECENT